MLRKVLLWFVVSLVIGISGCKPRAGSIPIETSQEGRDPTAPVVVKIFTRQTGIYAIKSQDLARAGINLAESDMIPVHLYWRGKSLPVWIDRDAGELRFYASASQSLYSLENVYWLVQGDDDLTPGSGYYWKSPEKSPAQNEPELAQALVGPGQFSAGVYAAAFHLEENRQYYPQVEQGDHWLWIPLPAPQAHEFDISFPEVEQVPGAIRLAVWARTEGPGEIDHHLRISINGAQVADESWDGSGNYEITAPVPAGVWRSGDNTILVDAPGDTGNAADVVVINWIDAVVGQKFQTRNDRLFFIGSGKVQPLDSFTRPVHGYDVTDGFRPVELDPEQLAGDSFTGQVDHLYWLVGAKGGLAPEQIAAPVDVPDLRSIDTGAEYVAIGPPDLLTPLQPLLDFRSQTGLNVQAVPLQAVYDQFNGGLPEPEAIRAFLRFASQNWQIKPRFLLLVGDATYDPLEYQSSPEANRLPVFLVETVFGGETASDVQFTQLDDDQIPDMAAGRIPAQSADQVKAFVEKTLNYEQHADEPEWKQRVLAVADGQEDIFKGDAQSFLDLFPQDVQTNLLDPVAGDTSVNQQVVDQINQGAGLVAYFGHGSINMWGKDRLFSTDDVANLNNVDRYPVMINMTCLNGLFTHPKVESLAEAMLWQPQAGAVAVLAPTSLTLPTDQSFLSKPLIEALLYQPDTTLGEALLAARRQIAENNTGSLDVMETFLLFGDPALRVPIH